MAPRRSLREGSTSGVDRRIFYGSCKSGVVTAEFVKIARQLFELRVLPQLVFQFFHERLLKTRSVERTVESEPWCSLETRLGITFWISQLCVSKLLAHRLNFSYFMLIEGVLFLSRRPHVNASKWCKSRRTNETHLNIAYSDRLWNISFRQFMSKDLFLSHRWIKFWKEGKFAA